MKVRGWDVLPGSILGSIDIDYLCIGMIVIAVLLLILIVLLIMQSVKMSKLKKRLDKFLVGREGTSLEQDIIGIVEDNKFLKKIAENNRKDIRQLYKRLKFTYQKMGLVKYDAFSQMGGQISFCLALLDENDNGFILNSVHSTEGCYSYTKEIKGGGCSNPNIVLSKEEEEALDMAKSNFPTFGNGAATESRS